MTILPTATKQKIETFSAANLHSIGLRRDEHWSAKRNKSTLLGKAAIAVVCPCFSDDRETDNEEAS